MTSASFVYTVMICGAKNNTAHVRTAAMENMNLSIIETAFFSDTISLLPQYCAVRTAAPHPIPIHRIWNILMKSFARDEAESCTSPYFPSMIVSIIFTPIVMTFCRIIGVEI